MAVLSVPGVLLELHPPSQFCGIIIYLGLYSCNTLPNLDLKVLNSFDRLLSLLERGRNQKRGKQSDDQRAFYGMYLMYSMQNVLLLVLNQFKNMPFILPFSNLRP